MDGQNSEWTNTVQQAVFTKFARIIDQSPEKVWAELAAIVLYDEEHQDELDVVCIATGTKTIHPGYLQKLSVLDNGTVVIDHHGEILARRCFVNYLYKQLDQIDQENCILVRLDDNALFKYKLKDNIKIILYISSAPCGGCRQFNLLSEFTYDPIPNMNNDDLDQLRRKPYMEEPFRNELEDNPDKLQVMSCSDKITKWNVLGVQGALLGRVIVPIYLEHIVISEHFKREHLELQKANFEYVLINRISGVDNLPSHYKSNKCQVDHANTLDQVAYFRNIKAKPEYSINWVKDNDVEILRETTGLKSGFNVQPSRLCKKYQFNKYKVIIDDPAHVGLDYELAKLSNISYQSAKSLFKTNINKNAKVSWRKVSHFTKFSLDNFPISDHDDKFGNRIYLAVLKQVTMLNQQLSMKISTKYAAIVVTDKRDHDYFDVISLATDAVIFENEHVNNYHAVLLTRKCLINYMKDQLNRGDQNLFIQSNQGRYIKNPDIQLNLFINDKPSVNLSENSQLFKSSWLDLLIMWSFLGVQGASLSNEVDPYYHIHLDNIVINDSTDKKIIDYIKQNKCFVLDPRYKMNKMNIMFSDCDCSRYLSDIFDDKTSHSLNWIKDQEPELVDHLTGKNQLGETSRLSKDKHKTSIICQTNYHQVKEDLKSQLGYLN